MQVSRNRENELHEKCRADLDTLWQKVCDGPIEQDYNSSIAVQVADLLRAPTGTSSTFRFVLPTQLIAKFSFPSLDVRNVQKGPDGDDTAFDARSLASHVIVPFNRRLGSPLGPTGDPYVNNPLRVPQITDRFRAQQRDKARWDTLCDILEQVQNANDEDATTAALSQTLVEIRRLLEETRIIYPVPQRISLDDTGKLLGRFLDKRTGGRRLQAVAFAMFRTLSKVWNLYDEVLSAPATAADAPTERPADIDCRRNGLTVLAVEVKDRTLTMGLLEDKIVSTRIARVKELLFLIRANPVIADISVSNRIRGEFTSGQNIYVLEAEPFFVQVGSLIGETGRAAFVVEIGSVLDELPLDYTDRREWFTLLTAD